MSEQNDAPRKTITHSVSALYALTVDTDFCLLLLAQSVGVFTVLNYHKSSSFHTYSSEKNWNEPNRFSFVVVAAADIFETLSSKTYTDGISPNTCTSHRHTSRLLYAVVATCIYWLFIFVRVCAWQYWPEESVCMVNVVPPLTKYYMPILLVFSLWIQILWHWKTVDRKAVQKQQAAIAAAAAAERDRMTEWETHRSTTNAVENLLSMSFGHDQTHFGSETFMCVCMRAS